MKYQIINKLYFHVLILFVPNLFGYPQPCVAGEKSVHHHAIERKRLTERTYVFSRAQFIYSIGNRQYLHQWVDRPLFINAQSDANKGKSALMTMTSYITIQDIVKKYGIDGLAFFPQTSGRTLFSKYSTNSLTSNFHLLYELTNINSDVNKANVVRLALSDSNSFKIKGKPLLTSYQADRMSIKEWAKILSQLHKKYGDNFIFLADIAFFAGKPITFWENKFHNNNISQEDIDGIKAYLRNWLQISDGLYFASAAACVTKDRNFDKKFYSDFVVLLMKTVLSEPKFKNKYFGLSAVLGHENSTRVGYTLNSNGTKTLRESFEIAMQANPEIINIPEWDEQNENTSLRPTIYNGLSSMRIMRYYMAKIKKQSLTPLDNNNNQLPDLIISTRKVLTLGEKLNIELLNVPESSDTSSYKVQLELTDLSDSIVFQSPIFTYNRHLLKDYTISLPSEKFAELSLLRPKIVLMMHGQFTSIDDGLHYIELRPTWNWDYKWVKQSIRDLIHPSKVHFSISTDSINNVKTANATFWADKSLAYVELLDNDDVAYSYNSKNSYDFKNRIKFEISWLAMGGYQDGQNLQGTIILQHSSPQWVLPENTLIPKTSINRNTLSLKGLKAFRSKRQWITFSIPKSDTNKATLFIDIPGLFKQSFSIKDLLKKEIYGIPGPHGLNIVISHDPLQDEMPDRLGLRRVEFSIPIYPSLKGSVICLQAIGDDGQEYRSKPIIINNNFTKQKTIPIYSDSAHAVVAINIDEARIPDINYEFDPKYGSVLMTNAGRPFRGILGGFFAQATGRGGGGGGDDISFINNNDYPQTTKNSAPTWVKIENNNYALKFDGRGTFVSLPQGVLPMRTGFTLILDIKPLSIKGKQIIIANRNFVPGSITLYTQDGILKADYKGRNTDIKNINSGLRLALNKWSHVVVKFDGQHLQFSVDNKNKSFPIQGPGLYNTPTTLGGFGNFWFDGLIKSLRIKHYID